MPSNLHFASALRELIEKRPVQGLFARCFAEADGDEAKTRARYIALRAAEIEEEERVANMTRAEKLVMKERATREARENELKKKQAEKSILIRQFSFELFKKEYRREVALHYYGWPEQQLMFKQWQKQKLESVGFSDESS